MVSQDLARLRVQYSPLFMALVLQCLPKRPQLGVDVLCRKSELLAAEKEISFEEAYRLTYEAASARVAKRVALMAGASCNVR